MKNKHRRWCQMILFSTAVIILASLSYLLVKVIVGVHGTALYYTGVVLIASVCNLFAYERCRHL